MGSRIRSIIKKEFIQIRRDRRMFGLVLMMPVVELFIFGYVVANDVDGNDFRLAPTVPGRTDRHEFE